MDIVSLRVQRQLAAYWNQVDWNDLDGWMRIHRFRIVQLIRAGQLEAALLALPYLRGAAAEAGVATASTASASPQAMVAGSFTAEKLADILGGSVRLTKFRIAQGYEREDALKSGGQRLLALGDTLTRDVGREALQADSILEPHCVGYERVVPLPACSRCLLLAGKFFKDNQGFPRHPACNCYHAPVYEADGKRYGGAPDGHTPDELFERMSTAEQNAALGKDADLVRSGKVSLQDAVNTRMRSPDKLDRAHVAARTPKGLRLRYGSDPIKFAEEMAKAGYLA